MSAGGIAWRRFRFATVAVAGVAIVAAAASANAGTAGKTTIEQRIVPDVFPGFRYLKLGPGEPYLVREDGLGTAAPGRKERRVSIAYLGQMSDFQLADEESPLRVEFLDPLGPPLDAAFRPWEALNPQIDDAMVRQINAFAAASPLRSGDGSRRAMDLALNTGDLADNQQLNETEWVRTLLEGGALNPNSGIDPAGYINPTCLPGLVPGAAEAAAYTGVQDYDDYAEGIFPYFYDPDDPRGEHAEFPAYPGLMDEAQKPFNAAGLEVPSYVAFGNHDALAQGNQAYNAAFEQTSTGCIKPISGLPNPTGMADALASLSPATLSALLASDPANVLLTPPDPARQAVSKKQFMDIFRAGTQADGHGFDLLDPGEVAASGGAAGYYSFEPIRGLRMISIDTISEGGVTGPSSDGNVDDPQFQWLEAELEKATKADELIVLFSHHAIQSLNADVPDEVAPACTAPDPHGHDLNPGCDLDPRRSSPIHLGADLTELVHRYPHVVAWIAGHTHVNDINPFPDGDGGGFWMIRTAAEADWPQQSRLVEIFDNRDGTLSIFGTILDHASPSTAPPAGVAAAGMSVNQLASIGRTLAYNDHQIGARECEPAFCGEGEPEDRNVELLIDDPRRRGAPAPVGATCEAVQRGTKRDDLLKGTNAGDDLRGRGGADKLKGRAGRDCLRGGSGRDILIGGRGSDRLDAGAGADTVNASDRKRDRVNCGAGKKDLATVDKGDKVRGCEKTVVRKRR